MSGYRLTYRSTMYNPKLYTLKFVAIFIFAIIQKEKFAFALESASLHKKNNSLLLLRLNIYKISYFIGHRCRKLKIFIVDSS